MPSMRRRGPVRRGSHTSHSQLLLEGMLRSAEPMPLPWPDKWPVMVIDVHAGLYNSDEALLVTVTRLQGFTYPRWRTVIVVHILAPPSAELLRLLTTHSWLTALSIEADGRVLWSNEAALSLAETGPGAAGAALWSLTVGQTLPAHAFRLAAVTMRAEGVQTAKIRYLGATARTGAGPGSQVPRWRRLRRNRHFTSAVSTSAWNPPGAGQTLRLPVAPEPAVVRRLPRTTASGPPRPQHQRTALCHKRT